QPSAPEIIMAWQGGEPTMMGLDFFRLAVELQATYAKPGQPIRNTLQTNGTLLNDEWGEFLSQHEFLVGISIDGPRQLHDRYRVDKGGKPTYDRVIRGLDILKTHGVEWNVLTTVHATNGDHGRYVYTFLRDELGADFVQFIPIIERATSESLPIANNGWGDGVLGRPLYIQDGSLVTHRSVTAAQYGAFMIDVFEEWVRHDIGKVFVQLFDTTLTHFYGAPGGMCVHAETCGTLLAIEHNGDLYSCDHYVEPDYLLGNIKDTPMLDLIVLPQQVKFGLDKRDTLTKYCRDCDVRFACNGGCPKDRFIETPDGEPGLHYLCAGYKGFFRHVSEPMTQMSQLLRAGRAPAELMDGYSRQDAQRLRNSPCPCGNGRKWKKCHGSPIITTDTSAGGIATNP
ncbi:MAG: anaerobic sulfatase maturase, partial [Actinobacteria bacterium]|nr:anaerobic sulfatase maturase [Actinomycetota bacterium]